MAPQSGRVVGRPSFFGKAGFIAVGAIFAAIGAHALNPREMYPLDPVKQDAFYICDQGDPTFVRAVGTDREACYDRMPHVMAMAMGRIKPGGVLAMQVLTHPPREAELLMVLAATPPRQPVTVPRLFSNTAWMAALARPCKDKRVMSAPAFASSAGFPPSPSGGRAAALPRVPVAATGPWRGQLPVMSLDPGDPAATEGDHIAAASPLPAPDVGDAAAPAPAIVLLAPPATICDGA